MANDEILPWRTAWVTGGSSGIGRELALRLALGGARVVVTARGEDKLAAVAERHERILTAAGDVTRPEELAETYANVKALLDGVPELVVLNAGIWQLMGASDFDAAKSAQSMAVNYLGIANGLDLVIDDMIAAGRGHIALVASVAGYRGLPRAAAYAPSKAAVIALAESLKPHLDRRGVTLSLVNPGFVDTPMTKVNDFPMPFLVTPDEAARRIVRGLVKKKFEIVFPWQMMLGLKLMRLLPYALYFPITRRMLAAVKNDDASQSK